MYLYICVWMGACVRMRVCAFIYTHAHASVFG